MGITLAQQDELFPNIARSAVAPSVRDQYNRFRSDFDKLGGIVPPRMAATLAGVSRQRVYDLIEEKKIRSCTHADSVWVSLSDIIERVNDKKAGNLDKGGRPLLHMRKRD